MFVDFLKAHKVNIDNNFDWYKVVKNLDELDDDNQFISTLLLKGRNSENNNNNTTR